MYFSSTRRRVLAALAAVGATGFLPAIGRAQDAQVAPDTGTVPCSSSSMLGTFASPANNYMVTATRAEFAFVAHIKAVGEGITLYADADHGGVSDEGLALVKGTLVRSETDAALTAEGISFESALTALHKDGNYYGIVQMSHDQKVPVGLMFSEGGKDLGGFELKPGEFDPTSREVTFNGDAAAQLYSALMGDKAFTAALMVGGTTYSEITTEPGAFARFVDETLVPGMDEEAAADVAAPCYADTTSIYDPNYDITGGYGCFLTTACCNVVGLADDCWELQTLRRFRDGWMSRFEAGRADIARYYREAPAVADRLMASASGRRRLLGLYWSVIVPAALLVRAGLDRPAYQLYRRMMLELLPA